MDNQKDKTKSTYSISKFNTVFSVIVLSLIIASICLTVSMGIAYQSFCDHQNSYNNNIKASKTLRESYDNLTTQFRRFVLARDQLGFDAYFAEFDSNRRDIAIQELSDGTEGGNLLSIALADVNEITEIECHAIALAAKASDLDFNFLRSEISDYPLTAEEKALSKEKLIAKASQLAFGSEFGASSERIDGIIDQYTATLLEENSQEVASIRNKVTVHIVVILICLVALVIIAFIVFSTEKNKIVVPLQTLHSQMTNGERLSENIGVDEIREMTSSYNTQMEELMTVHSVEAGYQKALMADAEAIYEINVSKDLIIRIISEAEYKPLSALLHSIGLSLPCSLNEYAKAASANLPNARNTVFSKLSSESMMKEYKAGIHSACTDSEITLFGETKKIRSIALYREDPKTNDVIAMIVIKARFEKDW